MPQKDSLTVLGKTIREAITEVEVFQKPPNVECVVMATEEFTSLCPVTGQPDFGIVEVDYIPNKWCIESKSLKLYLWQFREAGCFCESLASNILDDLQKKVQAKTMKVTVKQKPRGGIGITATAEKGYNEDLSDS